jgi:hypothetical protein
LKGREVPRTILVHIGAVDPAGRLLDGHTHTSTTGPRLIAVDARIIARQLGVGQATLNGVASGVAVRSIAGEITTLKTGIFKVLCILTNAIFTHELAVCSTQEFRSFDTERTTTRACIVAVI